MASYSTVNFLGAGENLEIRRSMEKGSKNYVSVLRALPVFDLPITLASTSTTAF